MDHPEWANLTFAPAHTNPPVLSIGLVTNGMVLSWLATNQSTRLEYATNLPSLWQEATVTAALTNGQLEVRCSLDKCDAAGVL